MSNKRSNFSSMAEETHLHHLMIDKREIFVHGSYAPDDGDRVSIGEWLIL